VIHDSKSERVEAFTSFPLSGGSRGPGNRRTIFAEPPRAATWLGSIRDRFPELRKRKTALSHPAML